LGAAGPHQRLAVRSFRRLVWFARKRGEQLGNHPQASKQPGDILSPAPAL